MIQPLEWNCKVTFLNKSLELVRKYDHGSAIFWRDAIPTHVLLQSDMCLAPPPPELSAIFNFHLLANDMMRNIDHRENMIAKMEF